MWGKRGEAVASYIRKGEKIAVSGDLSTREHNGKTYLQVRADDITLLGGKGDGGSSYTPPEQSGAPAPAGGGIDDEIPF